MRRISSDLARQAVCSIAIWAGSQHQAVTITHVKRSRSNFAPITVSPILSVVSGFCVHDAMHPSLHLLFKNRIVHSVLSGKGRAYAWKEHETSAKRRQRPQTHQRPANAGVRTLRSVTARNRLSIRCCGGMERGLNTERRFGQGLAAGSAAITSPR